MLSSFPRLRRAVAAGAVVGSLSTLALATNGCLATQDDQKKSEDRIAKQIKDLNDNLLGVDGGGGKIGEIEQKQNILDDKVNGKGGLEERVKGIENKSATQKAVNDKVVSDDIAQKCRAALQRGEKLKAGKDTIVIEAKDALDGVDHDCPKPTAGPSNGAPGAATSQPRRGETSNTLERRVAKLEAKAKAQDEALSAEAQERKSREGEILDVVDEVDAASKKRDSQETKKREAMDASIVRSTPGLNITKPEDCAGIKDLMRRNGNPGFECPKK